MQNKINHKIILLIIFFAGFSFLIYEVSWNRYLSFILGTTVTASTIVLSAFMAGFGLGALILSKYIDKCNNLGKFLAKLLAGISIMSFVNYFIFEFLINNLFGTFSSLYIADIIFFSLTFILLLIPAFFMGGVIPLVSKIVISKNKDTSNNIGKVYAFETLGSTLGGLFAGFVLLGSIGQKETIFVAVAINIILSAYLLISKRLEDLLGIIKTFHSVFQNSTVWLGQYHAILIGKKGNGKIDFGYWQNAIRQMPKDDFFYFEPYHIAANVIFDAKKI